jgi:hypothetical protein
LSQYLKDLFIVRIGFRKISNSEQIRMIEGKR